MAKLLSIAIPGHPGNGQVVGLNEGPRAHIRKNTIISIAYINYGGRSGIRTHGGLASTAVFKTAALNRSAILPQKIRCVYAALIGNSLMALTPPQRPGENDNSSLAI